jgi:hypothetical protein
MPSRSERIAAEKKQLDEDTKSELADIAEAKVEITALIDSGFLDHGPTWAKAWYELGLRWSEEPDPIVTLPESNLEELIRRAKENPEVFELVKFAAALRLSKGLALPSGLSALIADYLEGKFVPPSAGKGRKTTTWGRDFVIARTIQILDGRWEHRRPNKRKDARNGQKSISEIVHLALQETPVGLVDVSRIQRLRSGLLKSSALEETLTMVITWEFEDYEDGETGTELTPVRRV